MKKTPLPSKFKFLMCLILVLEMVTVPNTPRSINQDSSVDVELDTNYLKMAKKGGGHKGKIINQDCALAVSGVSWFLTFASGQLERHFFLHKNYMLGTLEFTGSEYRAPSILSQSKAL